MCVGCRLLVCLCWLFVLVVCVGCLCWCWLLVLGCWLLVCVSVVGFFGCRLLVVSCVFFGCRLLVCCVFSVVGWWFVGVLAPKITKHVKIAP